MIHITNIDSTDDVVGRTMHSLPSGSAHTGIQLLRRRQGVFTESGAPVRVRFDVYTRLIERHMTINSLLRNDGSWTQFVLRIALAAVMFPHGAQKLFGWFGGYGFAGSMQFLTGAAGLPTLIAVLVILIECIGALLLALGLASRLMAFAIGVVMLGAALTAHLDYGFFMNWSGQQAGEGFEYHLLAMALAAAVTLRGGGRFALEDQVLKALESKPATTATA